MASSIQRFAETVKDPKQDVADLMSQAAVLARVLRQQRMVDWHKQEQAGYAVDDPLPVYRQLLEGNLVAWNPAQGCWVQAPISDKFEHEIARRDIRLGLREVSDHLSTSRKSGGERIDFTEQELHDIQQQIHLDAKLAFAMPCRAYAQIVESCRAVLRLWAEDLIAAGISGDGMKFSTDEKRLAAELDTHVDQYCEAAIEAGRENAIAAARKPSLFSRLLGA